MAQTLYLPKNGISTDTNGETLYLGKPDGSMGKFDITAVLTPQQVQQANQNAGNATGAISLARQVLQQQYGINIDSLPKVNKADLEQHLIQTGHVSNGSPAIDNLSINDFVNQKPDSLQGVDVNTDPSLSGFSNPNNAAPGAGGGTTPSNTNSDVQALLSNPKMATSGNYARVGNGSIIDTRTGQVVQAGGSAGAPAAPGGDGAGTAATSTGGAAPFNQAAYDSAMKSILSDPNLTADQKSHLQEIGMAMATGDKAKFGQMINAFESASQFSDPYFKAQVNMSLDALKSSFLSRDSDLKFKQDQLQTSLDKAEKDYAASSEYNTLAHNQELQQYITSLKNDLQTNADNMAASGLTSSSKNLDAQKIINDQNAGLVESSNMKYNYQKSTADSANAATVQDNATQLQYYKDLAAQGKLADLRKTEGQVGSAALGDYSSLPDLVPNTPNVLGGQGGSIPEAQIKDAASAANATVGANQPFNFAF